MKKLIAKKTTDRKYISKFLSKSNTKPVSESQFWKKIALEQQIFIHAKNNT